MNAHACRCVSSKFEKSSSRRSLLFFVQYFSRPFRLSLAPTICPWVSEDVYASRWQVWKLGTLQYWLCVTLQERKPTPQARYPPVIEGLSHIALAFAFLFDSLSLLYSDAKQGAWYLASSVTKSPALNFAKSYQSSNAVAHFLIRASKPNIPGTIYGQVFSVSFRVSRLQGLQGLQIRN